MGLDCYLLAQKDGLSFTFRNPTPSHSNTWRRYSTLHAWVESLWIAAGRPNAPEPCDGEGAPELKADSDGNGYTIVMPIKHDGTMFNQVEFPLTAAQLEEFFRREDPAFDTPNSVDYADLTDDDEDLSEAEFYRNWNVKLLKMAKAFEAKGFKLAYNSWW